MQTTRALTPSTSMGALRPLSMHAAQRVTVRPERSTHNPRPDALLNLRMTLSLSRHVWTHTDRARLASDALAAPSLSWLV